MIKLKELLSEALTINGVTIEPTNRKSGGPIRITYKNVESVYTVEVDTLLYDGKVGVVNIWKNDKGEYWIVDNTGKTFKLPKTNIMYLIDKVKSNPNTITINTTALDLILTKLS